MSNYENIDIGLSFLKHEHSESSSQDVISILWVGCLPYLFPDEEIPVCLVMTDVNMFLFRIFLPEDDVNGETLRTITGIQEAMHCFYSFPLKSVNEIVVGLFDQGLRLEVAEEGPRGTFVFLTRDASKTAQFLDGFSSILGFPNEKELADMSRTSSQSSLERLPIITYPDENKIHALKMQLTEQELSTIGDRENLITYCIVYERRDDDIGMARFDDTSLPYLRSLILTNHRLFLCDEDYVHWPLPSFARAAPFTPQWDVVDMEHVSNVIAVDLWEDLRGRQSMTGCFGVSITFEGKSINSDISTGEISLSNAWNLMFQSMDEREQFVRSLACLWKNQFDHDLKVIYSKAGFNRLNFPSKVGSFVKGHRRNASGNMSISIPSSTPIETPEMIVSLDRNRLNALFQRSIAVGEDDSNIGVQYVMCAQCKPFNYPDKEIPVVLMLGKFYVYILTAAENSKFTAASRTFQDDGSAHAIHSSSIKISNLQQVIMGMFDQTVRLEANKPEETFVFVTRSFDRTNEFVQRLSHAILALPTSENTEEDLAISARKRTAGEIFKLYKQEDENEESSNYVPKQEFIHPNSNIKFVYPSDEIMEKLKYTILDYIHIMELFTPDNDFGVLLYALLFQFIEGLPVPYTIVVSERFTCLIKEDHVNYPLPLFVRELPDNPQYEVMDVQLIAALVRIEFHEFSSGGFSLVFNKNTVDPLHYDSRFLTDVLDESDTCLITDVNVDKDTPDDEQLGFWHLQTQSYAEREKVFNVLSKMWSNFYVGKTLPVLRKKAK